MNDHDWNILLGSEVFSSYLKEEVKKEVLSKQAEEEVMDKTMSEFDTFEKRVNASPELRRAFKKLQNIFENDLEYRKGVDQQFVRGVMLLKIEE